MKTALTAGTVFVTRDRGSFKAWRIDDANPEYYGGVCRPLKTGEVIHFAVWKGDRLESRKTYTLKDGDVTWESSGLLTYERLVEQRAEYSIAPQPADMASFMDDLMNGRPATLPEGPKRPSLPETEDNFVFMNRFGGTCPAWLRDAR